MNRVREICVSSWFGRWMRGRGWTGFTFPWLTGPVILYWNPDGEDGRPDRYVRVHEYQHAYQIIRYGAWGFIWRYLWGLRKGYRGNPLEVEAYRVENEQRLLDRVVLRMQ